MQKDWREIVGMTVPVSHLFNDASPTHRPYAKKYGIANTYKRQELDTIKRTR